MSLVLAAIIFAGIPIQAATITKQGYEGAYYVLDAYWSGRQSKIIIKTYEDSAHKKLVKTYTEYVKW